MTDVPKIDDRDGGALGAAVAALWELTHVLRAECPWDQAQSAGSIVPHTLEEAWEVADAARAAERAIAAGESPDLGDLEDELGDLLFQVCFLAMWCGERDGSIDLGTVARRIFTKLVRRHPHVFGDGGSAPTTPAEVLVQWDRTKRDIESRPVFDGIPAAMPPLARARKVQSRASNLGFDFGDARAALDKLDEEVAELREAIDQAEAAGGAGATAGALPDPRVEAELGDVLFSAVNVARLVRVDPELAADQTTRTFQSRVQGAVRLAADAGEDFSTLELDAQEAWYQRAKG
ncbi:MAG: nucleoside triphosphate hydrolase [Thermoleophilia bacterium]|nr:nucleoside triphosphate hydrolase [Thermoleophilia bacterium]